MRQKRGTFNIISAFLLTFLLGLVVNAQNNNRLHSQYTFKSLTVDDGIGNNRVRGLAQDHYGFIWIGSRSAMCKYNGYEIKAYLYFYDDTSQINFGETRHILSDSKGTLWAAGLYGICYYDQGKDLFIKFNDPNTEESFTTCNGIEEDSEGLLWFTSSGKFVSYNRKSKKFTYYSSETVENFIFPDSNPERLIIDQEDNIYISYSRAGFVFYNRKEDAFTHYESDGSPGSLGEDRIERIYEDDKGIIWIGFNNNGFSRFDPKSESFETFFPDINIKQSGRVRGLIKDANGNFWIGTQAGLYLFSLDNREFIRYAHSAHPVSELNHNSIQTMILDKQDGLWLGTFAGGVSFTNLNTTGFTKYAYAPYESPDFLNDKDVYSIAIDHNSNLWLGTENGGLNNLDRKTGTFKYYKHDPADPNTPLANNIKDIEVDESNNIWFATYGGGFSYFDQQTQKFTHFLKTDENPDGFPVDRIYQILVHPVDKDILLLGTIEELYFYRISTKEYSKVEPNMMGYNNVPEIGREIINSIYNYQNERVLIGADKLYVLDIYTNSFSEIKTINEIELQRVNFIFSDRTGHIWFDNQNTTLIRANSTFTEFESFTTREGMPDALFLEIADDVDGNIWLSSNKGIIRIDNFVNNRKNIKYHIYKKSDNLQSQEFLYNSKAISIDGEIHYGGINGFNSFYPRSVRDNPHPPYVFISNLKVENESVIAGEKYYGKKILEKPCIETDFIFLSPKVKILTIEFTGLQFASSQNNKFRYILEGYDEDWIETDAGIRFANYSNLPPGSYTFKVHAANYSGIWTESPSVLEIKVIRPLYKRWWFILSIILVISSLARMFIVLRERQLKHDKEVLEEKIRQSEEVLNKKEEELEKQKQELIEKEEAEKVNKWFNKGLGMFSDILSKEKDDLKKLSGNLISNIVEYVGALQGGLFLVNDTNKEEPVLELISSYAFNREKLEKKVFVPGEGEVGVCFERKEVLVLDNLPESYAKISSSLGESRLTHLTLVPLKRDEYIMGVIEIASMEKIEQFKIDFLEKISENIVSVLYSLKSNEIISEMLQQSKEQAEELHSQEEEMRQNMEEMKTTQEESSIREERAQNEISALKEEIKSLKTKLKNKS